MRKKHPHHDDDAHEGVAAVSTAELNNHRDKDDEDLYKVGQVISYYVSITSLELRK